VGRHDERTIHRAYLERDRLDGRSCGNTKRGSATPLLFDPDLQCVVARCPERIRGLKGKAKLTGLLGVCLTRHLAIQQLDETGLNIVKNRLLRSILRERLVGGNNNLVLLGGYDQRLLADEALLVTQAVAEFHADTLLIKRDDRLE
jgi:hypothetical protein